jgi:hypothetical protein
MTTATVTELPRALEPVTRDPFSDSTVDDPRARPHAQSHQRRPPQDAGDRRTGAARRRPSRPRRQSAAAAKCSPRPGITSQTAPSNRADPVTPHRHGASAQAPVAASHPSLAYRPRRAAAGLLLVAALIAGCGGDSTASVGTGPVASPASGVGAIAPAAEIPTAPTEPAYEAPAASGTGIQPESDAESWVDRRQDDVLDEVHDNNIEAIEGWTP